MGLLDPPGFRRNRHGEIWMHLGEAERALMSNLLEQLDDLLDPGESARPTDPLEELVGIDPLAVRPSDPALARLFPDAYTDPEQADEFRRFTQRDLREGKRANLTMAQQSLARPDPTRLDREEAMAWLRTLNDMRLTLGTRLAVTEDDATLSNVPDDDPRRALYAVYDWLTYHQDRLVQAMAKGLR